MHKRILTFTLYGLIFIVQSIYLFHLQAATLSAEEVRQAVKKYVLDVLHVPPEKVVLEFKHALPDVEIPSGELHLKVYGKVKKEYAGRITFRVDVYVDGQRYRTLYPSFNLDYLRTAFMTRRWVNREERLTQENVFPVEMRQSLIPPHAVTSMEELQGKIARVAIPKGRVVTLTQVVEPPLIRKKQIVTLKVDAPGLKVEAKGEALTDGRKGESIKVKNVDSGKILYGKVEDGNTVVVSLP